mmetsp:Transcript_26694/g.61494  ORF Transcript_26694/g.61494 Transcript_26694/m.61494 type:complete len:252 (-) Transcript_26694:1431-2186(-)
MEVQRWHDWRVGSLECRLGLRRLDGLEKELEVREGDELRRVGQPREQKLEAGREKGGVEFREGLHERCRANTWRSLLLLEGGKPQSRRPGFLPAHTLRNFRRNLVSELALRLREHKPPPWPEATRRPRWGWGLILRRRVAKLRQRLAQVERLERGKVDLGRRWQGVKATEGRSDFAEGGAEVRQPHQQFTKRIQRRGALLLQLVVRSLWALRAPGFECSGDVVTQDTAHCLFLAGEGATEEAERNLLRQLQ